MTKEELAFDVEYVHMTHYRPSSYAQSGKEAWGVFRTVRAYMVRQLASDGDWFYVHRLDNDECIGDDETKEGAISSAKYALMNASREALERDEEAVA